MKLALFDLDNTLLDGDSDYAWAQFLIEEGVLHPDHYHARNEWFYERYKDGTLDIHEFLDFQLAPIARRPRAQLDAWHNEFMQRKVRPMILPRALLGKSSIEYLNADDKERPKSQSYKGFADAPIAFKLSL